MADKPKRIAIDQIASWRNGEVITETKLDSIFSLIGEVINNNADSSNEVIQNLMSLAIPKRWLGTVLTYSGDTGIDEYIKALNTTPEFLESPAPKAGDTIMVDDNSDDEGLPSWTTPGRYTYVYVDNPDAYIGYWQIYTKVFDPKNDVVENAANAQNAMKIFLDNVSGYKFLQEIPISVFKGLTEDQINYRIYASGVVWNPTFTYGLGFRTYFIDKLNQQKIAVSLIENNIGNDPATSPLAWNVTDDIPVDVDYIVEQLKPYLNVVATIEIAKQLETLPSVNNVASMKSIKTFKTPEDIEAYIVRALELDPTLTRDDFEQTIYSDNMSLTRQIINNRTAIDKNKTAIGKNADAILITQNDVNTKQNLLDYVIQRRILTSSTSFGSNIIDISGLGDISVLSLRVDPSSIYNALTLTWNSRSGNFIDIWERVLTSDTEISNTAIPNGVKIEITYMQFITTKKDGK